MKSALFSIVPHIAAASSVRRRVTTSRLKADYATGGSRNIGRFQFLCHLRGLGVNVARFCSNCFKSRTFSTLFLQHGSCTGIPKTGYTGVVPGDLHQGSGARVKGGWCLALRLEKRSMKVNFEKPANLFVTSAALPLTLKCRGLVFHWPLASPPFFACHQPGLSFPCFYS